MKVKNCIIILLFFITANIFARDFELLSINQDSDELNFSENLVQSQNAQGIEVSISPTTIVDSEIIFAFDIRNESDTTFSFNEKSITFYEGNYEKNDWKRLDYLYPSDYLEAKKSKAITKTVFSAIAMGLSLLNSDNPFVPPLLLPPLILPGLNGLPNVVFEGRFYNFADSPSFDFFDAALLGAGIGGLIDGIQEQAHDIPFLEQNLLFSDKIKPENGYFGLVYVPEFFKPDLKIEVRISRDETLTYYYSRSDRKYIINPWLDRDYGRYSIVFGTKIPHFDEFNFIYMYNGTSIGWYLGFNMNFSGYSVESEGTLYTNGKFKLSSGISSSQGFSFSKNENLAHILGGGSTGITIKTVPYTWLLVGCGFNFYELKYQGNVYDGSTLIEKNVWLDYDNFYFSFAPQIGVSCLFGPLQITSLFEYRFNYAENTNQSGFNCKLMAGFAFD